MKVVVIDNMEWDGAKISDGDFQDNQMSWCVSTLRKSMDTIKTEIEIDAKNDIFKDEDVHCFLINVHCAIYRLKDKTNYERVTTYQAQAGVDIYRELLHLYRECSEKLRVVFFSPYADKPELLFHKKPENLILKHLEYLQVPFTWKQVQDKFEQYNKPVFNNASENLLSGYSLYHNQHPINSKVSTGKKKILFIDDQSNEWKAVFNEMFHEDVIEHLPYSNQEEFRQNLANGQVEKNVKSKLAQCHLVLSDFYLNENHDPGKWMNRENIEKISGFDLFHSIRATDKGKAIPYIMHTSSNKISYYKVFDQNGVDDWLVKDVRPNVTSNEKLDNYILFKQTIESIFSPKIYSTYKKMQDLWENIQKVKNVTDVRWWYSPQYNAELLVPVFDEDGYLDKMVFAPVNDYRSDHSNFTKNDIVSILESSWYAIRRQINKEIKYEGSNRSKEAERFLATSICNNLGKIVEYLGIKSGARDFSYLTNFLLQIRNSASHSRDFEYFELNDVFIYLDYFVYVLLDFKTLKDFQDAFKDDYIVSKINKNNNRREFNFPCNLLWLYIQFYNHNGSKLLPEVRKNLLRKRIDQLFQKALGDSSLKMVWSIRTNIPANNFKIKKWYNRTFIPKDSVGNPTLNENSDGQYLKIFIPNSWQ